MNEIRAKLDFFKEFTEVVEFKGKNEGGRHTPFLKEVIPYMSIEDEPTYVFFNRKDEKIQLNGFIYEEDENKLDLYVVDYMPFIANENIVPEITMTRVKEIANKAKKFFTQSELILENTDKSSVEYDVAKIICENKKNINDVNIYVVTSYFYTSNKPIDLTLTGVENLNIQVWDMDRIFKISEAEQGVQEFEIDFQSFNQTEIKMLKVPNYNLNDNKIDCYIGMIPALILAKLYDEFGPKLVERNVRSFLQARAGTNKGIRDTLKDTSQKEFFVAYNNGISSVAKSADIEIINNDYVKIKSLKNWQIVNGGQTTASIHQAFKMDVNLDNVYIQAKLTIINSLDESTSIEQDQYSLEDEMISKISEYANTQNKINKSDLLANTRFMADLEKLSRNTWIPMKDNRKSESKWYFERARGQYVVDVGRRKKGKEQKDFKKIYPKENVITKVDLAKCFMSWNGYPHVSSKGGEEAFKKFMEMNKKYWKRISYSKENKEVYSELGQIDREYFQKIIATKIINVYISEIINTLGLKGYKANVNYYTTAIFSHIYGDEIDLLDIWTSQSLPEKWRDIIRVIANNTLVFLKESAGEQNVTQWAKKEECWISFKEDYKEVLSNLI